MVALRHTCRRIYSGSLPTEVVGIALCTTVAPLSCPTWHSDNDSPRCERQVHGTSMPKPLQWRRCTQVDSTALRHLPTPPLRRSQSPSQDAATHRTVLRTSQEETPVHHELTQGTAAMKAPAACERQAHNTATAEPLLWHPGAQDDKEAEPRHLHTHRAAKSNTTAMPLMLQRTVQ